MKTRRSMRFKKTDVMKWLVPIIMLALVIILVVTLVIAIFMSPM